MNIPTAEEYINKEGFANWYCQTSEDEGEVVINYQDCLQAMIEFAKLHVEAALVEYKKLQKAKYYSGETGYLKEEDWDLAYPLNSIQ